MPWCTKVTASEIGRAATLAGICLALLIAAAGAAAVPFRSYDGTGNDARGLGAAGTALRRIVPASADYAHDDASGLAGVNPRVISNVVFDQSTSLSTSLPNAAGASNFLFQWGQFLDHDLSLTHTTPDAGHAPMFAPGDDPHMPGARISFTRSQYTKADGGVREQINALTAFIDASNLYGSSAEQAAALRRDASGARVPGGKLATSAGDLLPFDPHAPGLFLAGDERANEQFGLTAMHTLFVREHNYWAERLAGEHPAWEDDTVFEQARRMVGAEMQAITYNEFLPTLLGSGFLPGLGAHAHDPELDPRIANEFSAAAFRVGHTLLPNALAVLEEDGSERVAGGVALADAFFRPDMVTTLGIEPILRGLGATDAQEIDNRMVDGVRNLLFAMPGMSFGMDLAALNIQRGRDHGLPAYNDLRVALGLDAVAYGDGVFLPGAEPLLMQVYQSVDDIDPWVGLLAEIHHAEGMVGESIYRILLDQFSRLMHGDAFWYESILSADETAEIDRTLLSDIIVRNTGITWMQENVFLTAQRSAPGTDAAVPEPATLGLLCPALVGLMRSRMAAAPQDVRAPRRGACAGRSCARTAGQERRTGGLIAGGVPRPVKRTPRPSAA